MKTGMILSMVLLCAASAFAETKITTLPPPSQSGGMPLKDALKVRRSTRSFDEAKQLTEQQLSDLLWAAFGVNRPKQGKRTAPSAFNWQDISIYVFTADGTWRYDAAGHQLVLVSPEDLRAAAGRQEYVATAPLSLVFVSDQSKMVREGMTFTDEQKKLTGALDAGHISQNVYLFCASEGLGAVARASVDPDAASKALGLNEHQMVVLGQTVGFSKVAD